MVVRTTTTNQRPVQTTTTVKQPDAVLPAPQGPDAALAMLLSDPAMAEKLRAMLGIQASPVASGKPPVEPAHPADKLMGAIVPVGASAVSFWLDDKKQRRVTVYAPGTASKIMTRQDGNGQYVYGKGITMRIEKDDADQIDRLIETLTTLRIDLYGKRPA
jgi:putative lipoic acid-binding regulatory protein